jgi:hypothetical protein
MNRAAFSILPFVVVASVVAQVPAAAPPAPSTDIVTETSRIARFVAGPGDRPQGFLLRNGTFVILSPGLAQRLPASFTKDTPLQVTGDAFSYQDSKTVQARTIIVAGVSYADDSTAPGAAPVGIAPPPPPAPGMPPPPPPGGPGAPPPPPPCGVAAPPPVGAGVPGQSAPPATAPSGATSPVAPANNGAPAPAPANPPANPPGL